MVTPSMRRLFLWIICVLVILQLYGENNVQTDSLIQCLRLTNDFRTKARLLLRISMAVELSDPEKALKYAQQARQIAQISDFDSAEIKAMILMGANYCRLSLLKEAILTGELIVEKASRNNMSMEIADGRGIMAVAYAQIGDFDNSSRLYFENLKLYEKINEKRLLGRTMGNIGADFLEQKSYIKALEYTRKALRIGLEIQYPTLVTDQYNNLAAIYQLGFNDLRKALNNYTESLMVAEKIEDYQQQGGIMLNIGRIYMDKKKYDSAYFYFNRALAIFKKLNIPVLIADSYTALGNYHFQKSEYLLAMNFARSGLEIGNQYGILRIIFDASSLLHQICLLEHDTTGAYQYLVLKTQANDSLYALQNKKELFKVEFQYNQDKIAKEQKISQLRSYFIFGFIILGLLSGLLIAILYNSRQKIKIKNAVLKKEKAEADLMFKNKELSINLMSLLKKNDLITEVSQQLAKIEKAPARANLKEAVMKLNQEIKMNSDDRLWQEFSTRFKETNREFYDKLLKKYPDLTQSESKLCAYLRLNMSTKEISDLTGQRPETLEKARYRLRKKFGLNNSEGNLVTFLSQI